MNAEEEKGTNGSKPSQSSTHFSYEDEAMTYRVTTVRNVLFPEQIQQWAGCLGIIILVINISQLSVETYCFHLYSVYTRLIIWLVLQEESWPVLEVTQYNVSNKPYYKLLDALEEVEILLLVYDVSFLHIKCEYCCKM